MMNGHPIKTEPAAKKLRRMIQNPEKIIICPGVYDGLSARIALSVGFDALYMVRIYSIQHFLGCILTICRLEREPVHLGLAMLIWALPTCMTCASMQR